MTKEEIILANREFLFPSVFHYFKEELARESVTVGEFASAS